MLTSVSLVVGLMAATAGPPPRRRPFTRSAAPSRCTSPASHPPRRCRSSLPRDRPSRPRRPTRSAGCCSGTCRRPRVTTCAGFPTGCNRGRSRCTPTRRRPGIRAIYNQSIPDNGYTYLTTRDGTKLAINVHPPTSPAGEPGLPPGTPIPSGPDVRSAVPDADRVLGLRVRQPGRTDQRHRRPREPDGLRGRRREHARHRLLGWRVRLLRAAAEPRRLRRDRDDRPPTVGAGPQGRDDGHLLRGDQPAVHGPAPAARASRPSHRFRSSTPPRRRSIRAASSTPALRLRGHRSASTRRSRPDRTAGSPGRTSGSRVATRRARATRCCTARRPT